MKKLLAVLLALTVAMGAFAQLTVGGYYKGNATFNTTGAAYSDTIRLNFAGSGNEGKFGFKVRIEGSAAGYGYKTGDVTGDGKSDFAGKNDFGVTYAYAYGKFFDGMLKLTAGKLDIYDYNLSSSVNNNVLGNTANDSWSGLGFAARPAAFLVQVFPVEGLNIGLAVKPARVVGGNGATTDLSYSKMNLGNLYYGVNYGNDMLDVVYEGNWQDATFYRVRHSLSVNYKGVENAMIIAGYKGSWAGNGVWNHGLYALLGYTMDKLYVELDTDLIVSPETYMYFEGAVEYDLGMMKVRGFAAYEKDDKGIGNGNLGYTLRKYSDSTNEMQFGAEVSVPFGNAGLTEFNAGVNYADDYGWKIPVFFRVAF